MLRACVRLILAGLMVVSVLAGCSSSADEPGDAAGEETPTSQAGAEEAPEPEPEPGSLEELIGTFVGDGPGGADVLIERDGVMERVAVGVGSVDGEALAPGLPFRAGSISKTFVSTMVLQLVGEGDVDLDETLGTYLADTPTGAETTIRQLLSHQSGIPNYTDQPGFFADVLANPSQPMSVPEVLSYIEDVPLGPVDQFAYSNTNYLLLGQLIEHLDGVDLNTSLQNRIAGPLGLTNTAFDAETGVAPDDLVDGWSGIENDGEGEPAPVEPYVAIASSAWAAGALISTTDDLAAFLAALTDGTLLSDELFAEMSTTGPVGYGLGLFDVAFSATQKGVGHNGSIPGYTSTMAIDPETGDTLVVLTNNDALIADLLASQIVTRP